MLKYLYNQPYLLLTLTILFWSGNFVIGRAVHDQIPPIGLAFWRWCVGALVVFAFAWPYLKRDWSVIVRSWPIIILLSVSGVAAFNTMVYLGLQSTITINALLMQSTMPVLIVALSYGLFGDALTRLQLLGVASSLFGVWVIVSHGEMTRLFNLALNRGDLWVLGAVICYAVYSTLLRKRPAIHPLSFLMITFTIGTLILLPLYIVEHFSGNTMPINRVSLIVIAYVAVFPSVLAYLFFNRGVELLGANRAGLFIHLMPVFGSLMAIVFLGEHFRWFHAMGIVLIVIGIILAMRYPATYMKSN